MSLHVFANFVTPFGTAANNRAESEGNITTLQKLLWLGETHSTVSAEAIRFALRRRLGEVEETTAVGMRTDAATSGTIPRSKDGPARRARRTSTTICLGT